MTNQTIGILHPGEMGISLAASAQNSGNNVYWASEGRSPDTRARAEKFSLRDAGILAKLCETCSVIVSICPPHAALEVANQVVANGFQGFYLDANAIAPQKAQQIEQKMVSRNIAFVDGGVIGGPAWKPGSTWLYLSGPSADEIAACFSSGPLETKVIGDEAGKASALKMCFAAYTKGTTALLSAVIAAAYKLDVLSELENQWGSEFMEQSTRRVQRGAGKAWRFAGEMLEIAATFERAGLPGEFHRGAEKIYQRAVRFRKSESVELDEIILALQDGA